MRGADRNQGHDLNRQEQKALRFLKIGDEFVEYVFLGDLETGHDKVAAPLQEVEILRVSIGG